MQAIKYSLTHTSIQKKITSCFKSSKILSNFFISRLLSLETIMNKFIILIIIIAVIAAFFYYRSNTNNKDAVENNRLGAEFLVKNKSQQGVLETASGLQYKVLTQGKGTQHPIASDTVKVHYHGTLIDGKVFDSSVDRGQAISFALNQVIPGWTEGVQLMVIGDKTRFFIPAKLAYGNRSMGSIGAGSMLIFDVELLGINE